MMDSSSAQHHHQEMDSQTLESMLVCTKTSSAQEKKPRPAAEQALKCPRCDSTNTKFCYYNNYSLSQPRYFCKSCRRYWTKGGTLRNVPVGGGCRRNNNKRSSSSSSSSSKTSKSSTSQDQQPFIIPPHHPQLSYDCNDLSLAFARLHQQKQITNSGQLGLFDDNLSLMLPHSDLGNNNPINGFLESNPQGGFYYSGSQDQLGMGQFEADYYSSATTAATSATITTTVKQEMSNNVAREGINPPVLFGFPWHTSSNNSGDGLSWINNGINGSSNSNWHGLLNSPLM